MTQHRVIGSSTNGSGEAERRLKACSQISVMAHFTEPGWQVLLDLAEEQVEIRIRDRSFGSADFGDEEMMKLYFKTPSTVYDLGVALIRASPLLEQVIDHQLLDSASPASTRDASA